MALAFSAPAYHIWDIGELIERASQPETLPERHRPFTVIDGGLS